MLKPVKMKKLKLIAPLKYKNDVCLFLHKMNVAHINDVSNRITDVEWSQLLSRKVSNDNEPYIRDYFKRLSVIGDIYSDAYSRKRTKGYLFGKQASKINVKESSEEDIVQKIKEMLDEIELRTLEIKDCIDKRNDSLSVLSEKKSVLQMIDGIDSKIDELNNSDYISNMLFKTDKNSFEDIKVKLDAIKNIVVEKNDSVNKRIVLITYPKELDNDISECLNGIEISKIDIPIIHNKPRDEIEKIKRLIKKLKVDNECHLKELKSLSERYITDVIALKEEAGIILDRYSLLDKCASTESSFVLEFFVAAKREQEVTSELMYATNGKVIIYSAEPLIEEKSDKVPVLLDNPSVLKPFEGLVNMYAVPKYDDIDSTVLIAPAMMLFFGIMLNDAGYGLLLALIGFFMYKYYRRTEMSTKNAGIMLVLLGLSSVAFGIISGGYFGDALRKVFPNMFYLIDPLGDSNIMLFGASVDNPIITVMIFSLVVGIVYINIGFILGIADCINKIRSAKHTSKKDGVRNHFKQITSHVAMMLFQAGLFGLILWWRFGWFGNVAYFAYIDGMLLVVSLVMLAVSGGVETLFGFFDVTGFVGDDLSFIRLLALCLATEGIANLVNMFAGFSLNIPYVGVVLGTLIFIFGHMFNLVVGTMGAGIHSLRLQYVEFFSKFYEGGGIEFEPYSVKRKYTVVEK